MTVKELIERTGFSPICEGDLTREIQSVYCCDMLSIAMGRAPADSAWVTVMGNVNSVAVGALADVSCILYAEGVQPDAECKTRAAQQGITLLGADLPVFDAALKIHQHLLAREDEAL
ncbi:hypothetical protein [Zongyangia hominis]|uniref:DRTGG domain-containing protein n=1 Tax=Zongyangia hominis TaxID=2763677 RepID=A0A926ECS2_9FIRM|nr:hypothetical protein [Zongyangia hominis]MBC8570683.1 hypothetical protein [Zongyangia hominis]